MAILTLPAPKIPKQPPAYRILRKANFQSISSAQMPCCSIKDKTEQMKIVWMWTESKQVMTTAVERGWNNFIFKSDPRFREIANEWSSIALINPLFMEGSELFDKEERKVASFYDVCNPRDLELLKPNDIQTDTVIINFHGEWQVIPAENIVATFQGSNKNVLAVSSDFSDAKLFFEALEHGLNGVVLKVEDSREILNLKEYFDRRTEVRNVLSLTKATVTRIEAVGMGDRVCVDLCSLMKPGEGLLVGSFARGLFLVHSECLESNYIASRPFRVNAGPVHSYVAIPGGKTCYLAELKAGKEVMVVDQSGFQRTAVVGRVKIESRPLILVEAKDLNNNNYSIFLQNAETVGLICPIEGENVSKTCIPVTSLKIGDEVILRLQGGARHTGLEIQEFILEK